MPVSSRIRALRRAADRLTKGAAGVLGRGASVALARVEPMVAPWLARTVQRLGEGEPFGVQGVRVTLEQYVRRTIQTSGATVDPPAPAPPGKAIDPGVLHLTRLVERRLHQLQRLQRFARTDDPVEAVHQLRVASRRLRAFVDLFGPLTLLDAADTAKKTLRRVTRAVRDLRDADVQSERLQKRVARATSEPERVALYHLLERARARRKKLVAKAARDLEHIDMAVPAAALRAMLDELARRAESPSANYALLAELAYEPIVSAVRQLQPRGSHPVTAEALHEYRLSLKKLRYAAEFIEPALGERFAEVHRRAKQLQDLLGDHQDAVEFERLVAQRRDKAVSRNREVLAAGLGVIHEQATRERDRLMRRCLEAARETKAKHLRLLPGSAD